MRDYELLDAVGAIDGSFIENAAAVQRKRPHAWIKWVAAAACLFLFALVGVLTLNRQKGTPVLIGGIPRTYEKDVTINEDSIAILWPWEYLTVTEQYTTLEYHGKEYISSGITMEESLLGGSLGFYELVGYDSYTEERHEMSAEVFRIHGISEERILAVQINQEYYTFRRSDYDPPKMFGELLDEYSLSQTLDLLKFTVSKGPEEDGPFELESDTDLWEILGTCRDAEFVVEEHWHERERKSINFTATSDVLGVFNHVFSVTDDGYLWTNVFDYEYIFRIGTEASEKIITYATEHGTKAEQKPYSYLLAGMISDISEEYVFIDDSALCVDEDEGMIFRIPLDDLRIRRHIEFEKISIGDTVAVSFIGSVNEDKGNVVEGAYRMSRCSISNNEVTVLE